MMIRSFFTHCPKRNKRNRNGCYIYNFIIFAAVMMKYILLFCMLLGAFFISGLESLSTDMKEQKALCAVGLQQADTQCNFSKADTEQCRTVIYEGGYLPSSRLLRFNTSSVIVKIVKSIKVLLSEGKRIPFPSCIPLTQYSSRYYVYALRHIII